MDIDEARPAFIEEARELLDTMESALLAHDPAQPARLPIDEIFRVAHTIKGSAGLFGLQGIVDFTHVCESALDLAREGRLPVDEAAVTLLLACVDHLRQLVESAAALAELEDLPRLQAAGLPLLQRLHALMPAPHETAPAAPPPAAEPAPAPAAPGGHWHLSLRFGSEVLRHGMDPLSVLRYLGTLGTLSAVQTVIGSLPAVADFEPECNYLGFELALQTEAAPARIDAAFDFVREDCRIHLLPPHSPLQDFVALLAAQPAAERDELVDLLERCGSVPAGALRPAAAAVVAAVATAPASAAPSGRAAAPREARSADSRSIRVDADKLDRLIDLVGELITSAASANMTAQRGGSAEVQECNADLLGLVEQVRDSAMHLRMVKIGASFSRFHRVVHDVSREIGKDIALELEGEDTELDKTVVERIGDPLMHLVRNAMDHGIEPAALRRERGKPERGTIRLNAYHDAGSIVIEVADDGGGLDRERILAKAVERGLVEAGAALGEREVFNLVFEPGFSTAAQVTNLSGRGVGMDVVRSNITALRGNVDIRSTPGQGTTVEIRLPLTLAIIHGFQVAVGDSVFVIPLEMVEECISFAPTDGQDFVNLRGAVLPFARLHDVFAVPGPRRPRQSVVVVRHLGRRAGLVVDALLGESQTVIKPLGGVFREIEGVAGSSILGSGEVALIVDVPALLQRLQMPRRAPSGLQPAEAAMA